MYSFPLVRYSCLLSAGVLHALLCLKVIPDVSMERDVFHVHLLLRHLVLHSNYHFLKCNGYLTDMMMMMMMMMMIVSLRFFIHMARGRFLWLF